MDNDKNTGEYRIIQQGARASMLAGEMTKEDIQNLEQTHMHSTHEHLNHELDDILGTTV